MIDGNIVVIRHESQEDILCTTKRQVHEVLDGTANKRDGLLPGQIVGRHLWNGCGDMHQIHEGQLTEQEVHWCVKTGVSTDEEYG